MAQISNINQKFIKLFSFINKEGKVNDINTYYGQKWSNVKTDNKLIKKTFLIFFHNTITKQLNNIHQIGSAKKVINFIILVIVSEINNEIIE